MLLTTLMHETLELWLARLVRNEPDYLKQLVAASLPHEWAMEALELATSCQHLRSVDIIASAIGFNATSLLIAQRLYEEGLDPDGRTLCVFIGPRSVVDALVWT